MKKSDKIALFVRLKKTNKAWVVAQAKKQDLTMGQFIDSLIKAQRTQKVSSTS